MVGLFSMKTPSVYVCSGAYTIQLHFWHRMHQVHHRYQKWKHSKRSKVLFEAMCEEQKEIQINSLWVMQGAIIKIFGKP